MWILNNHSYKLLLYYSSQYVLQQERERENNDYRSSDTGQEFENRNEKKNCFKKTANETKLNEKKETETHWTHHQMMTLIY